ncbi:ATP-dependent DNA helicase RecG [Parcubacteria bacterium DG_74_2]|nr:MAG: ATP-dependent DNA helicase RecG [Parcubacteria bacterium DG_74_2]
MDLSTPVEKLSRVGPQFQKKLKKLGIKTVRSLLFHFPHRYEDFSNLVKISELKLGGTFSIRGKINQIENRKTWKKKIILTEALVSDSSGTVKVVWFNQPYLTNVLKEGDIVSLAGKVSLGENGIYLSSPAYEKISFKPITYDLKPSLTHTGRLVPVYPETEGLSSKWLRMIIKPVLSKLKNKIREPIPEWIMKDYKLLPIEKALWQIHFPSSLKLAKKAKERFAFEELFLIHLFVLREKLKLTKKRAIKIPLDLNLIREFVKRLPFELTAAQKKSSWQILKDIEKERPMNRLLEGDVGSGKTIVAMIACLNVAKTGYQVALMAPTEILAKQHFESFLKFLKSFDLKIGILTSAENKIGNKEINKKEILEKVLKGKIDILIGTHALIQEKVKFKNLAFVIVDEQHRFGVEQRARLCEKKEFIPHLLSMTATPIPRTLALTVYGDLDLSILDEMPKGKRKVITKLIKPKERREAYDFIKKEVKDGKQVFVICPRIEAADNKQKTMSNKNVLSWAEAKAVKKEYEKLKKEVFPNLKIGMLHGKMKPDKKEKIMKKFKDGKIDILVSTSVVEVGVDIPNATVMMIEGAERFGLAQLHQFRGRIGRKGDKSFCFLFTESPAKKTKERLEAILDSKDGFELAEKDLKIRGPGELFGARQWGIPDLAMESLSDVFLVEKTRNTAKKILEEDSELKKYPFLKERLIQFQKEIHLE